MYCSLRRCWIKTNPSFVISLAKIGFFFIFDILLTKIYNFLAVNFYKKNFYTIVLLLYFCD